MFRQIVVLASRMHTIGLFRRGDVIDSMEDKLWWSKHDDKNEISSKCDNQDDISYETKFSRALASYDQLFAGFCTCTRQSFSRAFRSRFSNLLPDSENNINCCYCHVFHLSWANSEKILWNLHCSKVRKHVFYHGFLCHQKMIGTNDSKNGVKSLMTGA